METLTRIYIFFIGIIALMVCFITWVAIRLRAERINRIRIEKEKQAAETKIHNLEFDIRSLKKSVESYEGLHDGNKQIIDLKQAEITKLEERINRQSDIIKELEQDKENLINCISRTGIRGTDGVVRKCNLGEIQSVISGNHPILLPKVTIKAKDKFTDRVEKLIEDFNSVRSVTSLSEKECIEVKNDEERDDILRLFEEAGITWKSGDLATSGNALYNRENLLLSENTLYFLIDGYAELNNITILPVSDFIQPKNYKIDVNVMEQPIIMADSPTTDGGVESKQVEPPKPTRDWSVPQAFPDEYVIPIGTKVVCVADDRPDDSDNYSVGKIGIVQDKDRLPDVLFNDDLHPTVMRITELAPINPLDHPEHPQFNKK